MNKDVVYIEPEDDITDIIARVKNANQKVVALVPPKKIGVLRSAVNTKLIAKAAKSAGKTAVIVSSDSSLTKLAAAAQIPVASTLQSRPKLPSEIIDEMPEKGEQMINEADFDNEEPGADAVDDSKNQTQNKSQAAVSNKKPNSTKNQQSKKSNSVQVISSDEIEKDDKSGKKGKNGKKGKIPAFEKYRKWIIIGIIAFVALIIFLVWAFVFAPAANIDVKIRTTANNFSENVSFTTKSSDQDAKSGRFYLEEQKVDKTSSVEFAATGQKDIGDKASGTITLSASFHSSSDDNITVPAGSGFSYGGLSYTSNSAVTLANPENCTRADYNSGNCIATGNVGVTANQPGSDYNIGPHDSGWSAPGGVTASNSSAFSGGSSKVVAIVSQGDYDGAKSKLQDEGREDGRVELAKKFGDSIIKIDSSLDISTSEPQSNVSVGSEVQSGVTPKMTATTTYTMYGVEKSAVEEFVKEKSSSTVAPDQRIYAVDDPFFENFQKSGSGYTAKLKTTTQTGPKVDENDILEKSKGRKTGEVQSLLKSINGVSSVDIKTSFPWVNTVPNDPNKITIELKVEE